MEREMRLPRFLAVGAMAGAMVLAQVVTSSPAQAAISDLACNYDFVNFNACLHFEGTGQVNFLTARIGLDVFESQFDAQQDVLTAPRAWLYGHDRNGNVRLIREVPLSPGWPAVGANGFGAEWSETFYRGNLNTNTNGDDAIYAMLVYYHQNQGAWITRYTGTVHGDFAPVVEPPPGGGGGCLRVCP
jgi:hypothetical protein